MAAWGKYREWLTPEGLLKVEGWARDGLVDEQIAHNMGIALGTFYEWRKKHSDFLEALKRGKDVVDREVENALLKSAKGFEYEEIVYGRDKDTGEMVEKQRIRKVQPPSTTAQIFWLKNRKPEVFRDKHNMELSGQVDFTQALAEAMEAAEKSAGETEA